MTEIGRRIVQKNGKAAIYLGPGTERVIVLNEDGTSSEQEVSNVYSLASGQLTSWSNANWTEDESSSHAQAVILLNPAPMKISTIFWGVVLAHLTIGVVVGLILILLH
ncbi:MAG: hypothetical protein WCA89_14190 [Terracidiphilus sp.]|jgi:hypothetical protein